jgi:hypothetical protein
VGNKSVQEVERARRAEEGGAEARARSKELENRLGRLWDLERFSDEEGYRDRTRHSHLRYRSVLWIRNDFFLIRILLFSWFWILHEFFQLFLIQILPLYSCLVRLLIMKRYM